jgi:DNA-binding NarL/FixJ family response regulator
MKIIIGDSNDIIRVGLRSILKTDTLVQLIGEATSSKQLLQLVKSEDVDVILLDYTAPNFSIDVVPKILNYNKNIKVVAITPEQNPSVIVDALKSGVISYIKKDCDIPEIIDSVRETALGNKFFCGQILDTIRKSSIDVEHLNLENFTCEPVLLTGREQEIIKYIAEGNTNTQIADLLCLSPHTVTTHRKNIMAKLGTKNTAGIVMYAVRSNIVSPNKFLFTGE